MDPLQVVTEPRRREILRLVADEELPAGEIAERLGASFSATSQHLARLREAGVVLVRRDGRRRLYRTDRARLAEVTRAIEAMWRDDLDRLADLAETAESAEQAKRPRAGGAS